MGIKCFLMTLGHLDALGSGAERLRSFSDIGGRGKTTVEPVMTPMMNYVPEEEGDWWGASHGSRSVESGDVVSVSCSSHPVTSFEML